MEHLRPEAKCARKGTARRPILGEDVNPEWAEHSLEAGGADLVGGLLTLTRIRSHRAAFVEAVGEV